MAQDFKINGTTLTHINDCQWLEQSEGNYLSGLRIKSGWRQVTISGDEMEESQFDIIFALEGRRVSVTIPPYDNRNSDYKTYYGAILQSVDGNHNGPIVYSVRASLLVKV